jgi:uncharacterized protein (TIGR02271 family)
MSTIDEVLTWRGQELRSSDDQKLGTIEEIYLDDETREPEWALITTGLFGTKQSFVPLHAASPSSDGIGVPFDKATVKDAPKIDPDGQLSPDEEAELYRHYGLDYREGQPGSGLTQGDRTDESLDGVADRSDARATTTDDAMTRSEEELRVGTTQRERGRARLRKYVVTEEVHQTVPVQREEVRVEREPITDANIDDALDGPAISEEEHEVTLHQEEVVTEKRAVPKERVRMHKETVTDEQEVSEELRKEQIETEGDLER